MNMTFKLLNTIAGLAEYETWRIGFDGVYLKHKYKSDYEGKDIWIDMGIKILILHFWLYLNMPFRTVMTRFCIPTAKG